MNQGQAKVVMEIANAIATMKTFQELFQVLVSKVKPEVAFDDVHIAATTHDGNSFKVLKSDVSPRTRKLDFYSKVVTTNFPNGEGYMQSINSPGPIHFTLIQMRTKKLIDPEALSFLKQANLNYFLNVPLRYASKTLGILAFSAKTNIFKKELFPFLQAVGDQFSVAVANIEANEEILKRENEKSLLQESLRYEEKIKTIQLDLNNSLLNIQDRATLTKKLVEELCKLLPIDVFGIKTIDESNRFSHRHFYKRIQDCENFEPIFTHHGDRKDFEEMEKDELENPLAEPVIYVGEAFKRMMRDFKSYKASNDAYGVHSVLLAPLIARKKNIALMVFKSKTEYAYNETSIEFLKRLLPQIAVVMENFFAYECIAELKKQLEVENIYLKEEVKSQYNFEEIIGTSEILYKALEKVNVVASTDSTVLILGETGTGKELFARAIHNQSGRKDRPLIKINCAALPAQLIESELFGHERGAFTGAFEKRIGKFEIANNSTLFLDEIGELPLELQAKLLRAIQEKEIERLGSNKVIKIDVRIIAATNRVLLEEIQAGRFRMDLYYRLNVFPITLPALRDRKEDIPILSAHFIEKLSKKLGKRLKGISKAALDQMYNYSWPGNIRELEYLIEQSAILSKTSAIKQINIPVTGRNSLASNPANYRLKSIAENERDHIMHVLSVSDGRIRGSGNAAEILGVPPTTLQSKMKKLGIKREHVKIDNV